MGIGERCKFRDRCKIAVHTEDTWVVGKDPVRVSSHDVQGLVREQAAVTQAMPIIGPDAHHPDHNPQDLPRADQQQQQQQSAPAVERSDTGVYGAPSEGVG